jgi:hypothetical protein
MAILASLRITRAELGARNQDGFLPQVFEGVTDLARLNLRVRDAALVVDNAEQSLVFMAIPYVLSVHHAYGVDCLRMVEGDDTEEAGESEGGLVELSSLHNRFMEAVGVNLPADLVGLFDLLRAVRNRITHYAGVRGSYLNNKWRTLPLSARDGWQNVAGRAFPTGPTTEELALGMGELIASLMVVTRLGREMNSAVAMSIPRHRWAGIAAEDFRAANPTRFGQHAIRLRRFRGFTHEYYGSLEFSDEELSSALQALVAKRPER